MAESLTSKKLITYFFVILIFAAVIGSVSVTYPFGRDQGIYAYAGKMLLEGKIDYKYVFDLKPPGVHFSFALGQLVFGKSMLSMRLFDIIWQYATGLVIFLITFKMTSSKFSGLLASFLYIFLYYRLDYWHTLQADGFLNLPFALSIFLLIGENINSHRTKYFFSGVLFGITILFKYTLILFLPLAVLVLFFNTGKHPIKSYYKPLLFVSGFIIVNLIVLIIYFFSGALGEFWNIQFVQIPKYAGLGYGTESTGFIIANIIRLFFRSVYAPLILLSVIVSIYYAVKKKLGKDILFIFMWAVSSVTGLIIQWKFFYYHFLVIIPSIAIGSAIFFNFIIKDFKRKYRAAVILFSIIFLAGYFILAFGPYKHNYADMLSYLNSKNSLEQLYIKKGFTSDSAFMVGRTLKAVDFVKNNTNINAGIFVWGFDPLVYYLSGRHCVSRFIYNFPLYWKENNTVFRQEFLNSINREKPKIILVSQHDELYYISGYKEDSKLMLKRFPEFNRFIEVNYDYKTQIDDFYIYTLKDSI